MKRAIAVVLLVSAVLGGLGAAAMMYVAWQHNPQGEFHEEDINGVLSIHWADWLRVGLSWFAVVFVPLSLVGTAVVRLLPLGRSRKAAG